MLEMCSESNYKDILWKFLRLIFQTRSRARFHRLTRPHLHHNVILGELDKHRLVPALVDVVWVLHDQRVVGGEKGGGVRRTVPRGIRHVTSGRAEERRQGGRTRSRCRVRHGVDGDGGWWAGGGRCRYGTPIVAASGWRSETGQELAAHPAGAVLKVHHTLLIAGRDHGHSDRRGGLVGGRWRGGRHGGGREVHLDRATGHGGPTAAGSHWIGRHTWNETTKNTEMQIIVRKITLNFNSKSKKSLLKFKWLSSWTKKHY